MAKPSAVPKPPQVRPATLEDVRPLVTLEQEAFDSDRLSARSFTGFVRSASAALLVAQDAPGAPLLGYALVLCRRTTSVARLYSIGVAAAARGRGVAQALMAAAETAARERGDLFMRLEVRADNAPAITLYRKLGYREFGRHLDYYEDHADALRFERSLIGQAPESARDVPYYAQTTDFTCGPAAIMIAMAVQGRAEPFSRRLELELWREANGIYLVTAPAGCDPLGVAVTLARRDLRVSLHVSHAGPFFAEGHRKAEHRELMLEAQAAFADEAAARGVPVTVEPLATEALLAALDRGAVALVLISTHRMYRNKQPHWVVAYDHDQRYVFVHDPWVDAARFESPLGKAGLAIRLEEFERMSVFGTSRLRAAVLVERGRAS